MPRDGYPDTADQTWFADYWKEFNESTYASVEYASYSNWHRRPFASKYINVDQNGRRVTWKQDKTHTPGAIQLALFGGSTMWGTGTPDDFTIPSYISKMLAEKYPHRFTVINYGQDGYVSTQELITLLREIQKDNIPDISVFYNGYNDAFTGVQSGAAGIPMNEDNRMREFNILHPSHARDFYFEVLSRTNTFQLMQGLRAKLWSKTAADSLRVANDTLGTDVTRAYFRNIESLTAIAKKYGMVSQFFWQPCVYTKTPPTPMETSIINSSRPIAS